MFFGRTLARNLLELHQGAAGFEDDPIVYTSVGGWAGEPVPASLEAELATQLARVFGQDARRLWDQRAAFLQERREQENHEAFCSWTRKKDVEARRSKEGVASSRSDHKLLPKEEERHAQDASWCRRYDDRRQRRCK